MAETVNLEHMLGLLKVRVIRGVNLVRRDVRASDPYAMVMMGQQKLKTRVVRNNVNPEWDDELTLCVVDSTLPVKLLVYDKDTFGSDDPMGHAEFDIQTFLEVVKMRLEGVPNNTVVKKMTANRNNCLADESKIYICDGKVAQDLILRLKDVESGEVELQLQWVDVPNSRGL
uniref:Putative ADP-ribosylation factor GTPase-activating protein AGD11 n=1 Tax=Anthurium amnicola TaxID=1678845 RepID=A0A1D1YYQ9_9ARAE